MLLFKTSLFSLFYKIILYIQGSRLRPFFWECASKNLKWSHFVSHTAPVSRAEAVQKQCVCRMSASARARRCAQRTERNGGFGFQTKVKDCFLKQRRWTCWYSCTSQFSLTFCFHFEKLVIFAVYLRLHYGGFPYFFILLLFDSSVFAKH